MPCEAHPFFFQVKESRRTRVLPLVRVSIIVESGPRHQQSNCSYLWSPGVRSFVFSRIRVVDIPCEASARSRKAVSCRARYWVNGPERRGPSQFLSLFGRNMRFCISKEQKSEIYNPGRYHVDSARGRLRELLHPTGQVLRFRSSMSTLSSKEQKSEIYNPGRYHVDSAGGRLRELLHPAGQVLRFRGFMSTLRTDRAIEGGEEDCLVAKAGIFNFFFVTPEGELEARRYVPPSTDLNDRTMATRGRRGEGSTRGNESAGGSQAPAQQAPDQTGIPLSPPPPLVDYGALMQGLVHAMQTQAQTAAALQAQVQAQAQAPAHKAGLGGVSMMERFRRMTPPFFKGESGPIMAESWLRETEKIFRAIRCTEEECVTLATYMLQDKKKKTPAFQPRAVVPARVVVPTTSGGTVAEKPLCSQCGKRHRGETAAAAAPVVARPAPRAAGRPRAQARVFALARDEAELAEHVTEGTVLIMGIHARVLFDTSATHSFIFEKFAKSN
ncbi:hypothetical protein Taro_050113 [Colocasia esculenta]|uniref:Uncharacterized protein n=1 Tax=Colocasia esculenta TaxID=4460 RepID=A0A843XCK0_COLES|nr:hypothetical protein [Colocasia esculenta]